MTRVTTSRIAQTYLAAGYQRAVYTFQQTLATQIASGGTESPLPSIAPLPPACVDSGNACAYQTSATIAFSGSTPAPTASCDQSQSNCAENEQANAYINESRVPARIAVTVTTRDGMQLAERTSDVILRTTATPPYAIIAGARDGSFGDMASARAEGDDGGAAPATPNPCSSAASGTADDTSIRVAYQNAVTNACTDGSSWHSSPYTIESAAPPGWSP